MNHDVIDAPDFDHSQMLGVPTDWRPGVRVAIIDYGLAIGRRESFVLLAIMFVLCITLGLVGGAIVGNVMRSLEVSVIIAAGLATCFGLLVILSRVMLPEQETVVDWNEAVIRRRHRGTRETFPLDQLKQINVLAQPESSSPRVTVQLIVANKPIPLLESVSCESIDQAYESVGVAAKHIASALNTPLTFPDGIDPNKFAKEDREWSDGYVAVGRTVVMRMQVVERSGNALEADRYRLEAMDYFDIANRIDPANPAPLLELANLSKDDGVSEQAIEMALSEAPDSPHALIQRGWMHDRRGSGDLAKRDFDRAVDLERSAETLKERALFHQLNERFDASIADINDVFDLAGQDDPLEDLLDSRGDCYQDWYDSTGDQQYLDLALADLRRAVSLDPDKQTSLCQLLIKAKSYDTAIATLDGVIQDHDDIYAIQLRGQAFLQQGEDMDQAVRDLTRVIDAALAGSVNRDPERVHRRNQNLVELYALRSEAHQRNGDSNRASHDIEQARRLERETG